MTNEIKILLTAFKGEYNSSYQLIKDFKCDKLLLTNSFQGLEKDISNYNCERYSAVLMFGLDTKLKDKIRIDTVAQNDTVIKNTFCDVLEMSKIFDMHDVSNYISTKPTRYLCNYAYCLMFERMHGNVVFIHISPRKYITEELKQKITGAIQKIVLKYSTLYFLLNKL